MQKGEPLETTYLTGGGSRSPVLRQTLADCTGNIMKIPGGAELGAKGAAINAGVAVGIFKDHAEAVNCMVKIEQEYAPDTEKTKKYAQLYGFYKSLIEAVWSPWEKSWEMGIADW
jgi:sugar (pentulose or hexulose) kinase